MKGGIVIEIFKLFGSVLVDNAEADKSISKTDKNAEGLGKRFLDGAKTVGKWGLAIGGAAIAAGAALFAFAKKSGDAADRLLDLNSITGMSTDEIQRWERVTKVAGVSVDAMTNASQKFTKTLDTMSTGTGKAAESAAALGFSYEDLSKMNADERMNAITQALAGVEDKTERAKLGTDLLGGSWKEIAPIVDLGADAMQKAKDSANIVSEEDLKKANDFRIRMAEMGDQVGHFAMMIGVKALPIMNKLFDIIEEYMPEIQMFFDVAFKVIEKVVTVAVNVIDKYLLPVLKFIFEWVQTNLPAIQSFFKTVFDTIGGIITGFVELAKAFWDVFGGYIMAQTRVIFDTAKGVIQSVLKIINGIIETFIGLFTGDWARMGKGLKDIWKGLWDYIEVIVKGAWGLLSNAFGFVWDKISGWFIGLKDSATQWGKNMIQGFIDGIKAMGSKVADAASGVVNKAADFLKFWSPAKKGEGRFITQWGENMIDGFLDGVKNALPDIELTLSKAIPNMSDFANYPMESSSSTFTEGYKEANIFISLDGRTIAKAIRQPLVDEIRVATGIRF